GKHTVEDAERHVGDKVERGVYQSYSLTVTRRHHQEVAAGEEMVEAIANAHIDDQRQMQRIGDVEHLFIAQFIAVVRPHLVQRRDFLKAAIAEQATVWRNI